MQIIKFIDKFLNFITIMFFLIIIAFSGYAFYDIQTVYNEAKLSDDMIKYKPIIDQESGLEQFNLEDLQNEINEDICGWIKIDGTNIDYPILYPDTTLEYLSKNYKKEYSPGGSIFIDTTNNRHFKDDYTVIYGHNMAEKMMFSDIKLFKDKEFFDSHKTGKLYTDNGIYNIKIYTFNILDSNKDIAYLVNKYKKGSNATLIDNFKKSAVFTNDIEITKKDQLIMLTTCNGVGTSERAVLFCKLEKNDSDIEKIDGELDKDTKKIEEEKQKNKQESEIKQIRGELYKYDKKNKDSDFVAKMKFYLKQPSRVIFFLLLLITIIIYIIVIIKRFKMNKKTVKIVKKGKKKKMSRIERNMHNNIE